MHKLAAITVSAAALAAVALNAGQAMAGGSSDTWPRGLPLPTHPGRVISQSSDTAVVRSTDTVLVVLRKLDNRYITQKGCKRRLAVNKPRDYLCRNHATGMTEEIVFTFAALDPTARHPARSQANAYYLGG